MRRLWGPVLVVVILAAAAVGAYALLHNPSSGKKGAGTNPSASPPPSQAAGYAALIMQDHPLAFWPLHGASGTTAPDSTGRYPGTDIGSPTPGAPLSAGLGAGTVFDGTGDHITADSLTQLTSWPGYTMEAWVRLTQESQEEHIIAFNTAKGGNGPGILHDQPTRKFKFRDCEGRKCAQVLSKAVPSLGVPYHLVVTVDPNNQGAFYVNGVLQARFVSTHRPPLNGLFTIGGEYDKGPTAESFFHGEISDVAVYDHALDAATVKAHYTAGL
ncbi:MAG TPA: LamG domain-containing protein [Actinomycetota bacterium]|nr:LamG domain-containing protein [Actinomycetota bacterium]